METILIENNSKVRDFISLAFKVGWPNAKLIVTHKGEEGINKIEHRSPDLIIIEPGRISDINGFDLIKQIRLFCDSPIIIFTENTDETSIVKGFELGADDYVVRPIGSLAFLARIRALLRRAGHESEDFPIICGHFCFYPVSGEFVCDIHDYKVYLTRTESLILRKLMKNPDRVVTHTSLAQTIWGEEYPDSNTSIRTHIKRLRAKLRIAEQRHGEIIHTKSGIGYSIL